MATYFRIIMSLTGLYVISKFPTGELTSSYIALIICTTILTSFCHTTMFVSLVRITKVVSLIIFACLGCLFR